MADTLTQHRTGDIANLLKEWGFRHAEAGKNHRIFKRADGAAITLRKRSTSPVGQYTMSEIKNVLGITEEQFLAGPPKAVPEPVSKPVSESIQPSVEPLQDEVRMTEPRRKVIIYLHSKGGSVSDPAGRASVKMAEDLGVTKEALSMLLVKMEKDGQTIKDTISPRTKTKSKKTYEIMLVPEGPGVQAVIAEAFPKPTPAPVEEPTVEEKPTPAPLPTHPLPPVVEDVVPESVLDYKKLAEQVVNELVHRLTVVDRERTLTDEVVDLRLKLRHVTEYAAGLRADKQRLEDELDRRTNVRRIRPT